MQHVATVGPTDSIGRIAASHLPNSVESIYRVRACVGSPGLVVCADLNESAARRVPSVFLPAAAASANRKYKIFNQV